MFTEARFQELEDKVPADFKWVPLEAKKAPWQHKEAKLQQAAPMLPVDRAALKAKREEMVQADFIEHRDDAQVNHGADAKMIEPVANLQPPANPGQMTLEQMREELARNIKARPRLVTVKDKQGVYLVTENSYTSSNGTLLVLNAANLLEKPQTVHVRRDPDAATAQRNHPQPSTVLCSSRRASRFSVILLP